MGSKGRFLDWLSDRRMQRNWAARARAAEETPLPDLREQRTAARRLRARLDRLLHVADHRLSLPLIGSTAIQAPQDSDWSWRPDLWRGPLPVPGLASVASKSNLGEQVTLFHDCRFSELSLRQLRNRQAGDLAPFGLRMDVFRFDGSYLSLAIDLPPEATEGLARRHLVRLESIVELESPLEIFARLNIKHGPNTEQVVRELPLQEKDVMVEFDLAYTKINERRIERLWLDLIFEGPQMNQVILRDLTLSRRPRADF